MREMAKRGPVRYFSQTSVSNSPMLKTQGDSGGPLTVANGDVHTLVGIVSERPGEAPCDQQSFSIFTSVSALLPWIESSIKENGGMASCSFNFSAPPSIGSLND